ncbi:hypothetical protein V1477_017395 [Vespula maculifrons]|uniref:Uncharacterized protein n=1 Tax=Vespula maculifrons TaxID=7453 RepID=A0ABD2B5W6_VESMC
MADLGWMAIRFHLGINAFISVVQFVTAIVSAILRLYEIPIQHETGTTTLSGVIRRDDKAGFVHSLDVEREYPFQTLPPSPSPSASASTSASSPPPLPSLSSYHLNVLL